MMMRISVVHRKQENPDGMRQERRGVAPYLGGQDSSAELLDSRSRRLLEYLLVCIGQVIPGGRSLLFAELHDFEQGCPPQCEVPVSDHGNPCPFAAIGGTFS